jgi:hypothetical protein
MAGTLRIPWSRIPRTRGVFSGVLLALLGLWGGLVPLVGPYLQYAYRPDKVWTVTSGRIWLEFLPAAGAVIGGLLLLTSRLRPWALLGASLAALSGAWFALGSVIVRFWMRTPPAQGAPVGGPIARAAEQIGFFTGLGIVIVAVAAVAIGRFSVISVRDSRMAERAAMAGPQAVEAGSGANDLTAPLPARRVSAAAAPGESSPPARKAPMAALTRIAGLSKPAGQSANRGTDTEATSGTEQVSSGAQRG